MDMLHKFNSDNLNIINELKKIASEKNINIYLVGGAVRDTFLNIQFNDLDFCLDCDPKIILSNIPFNNIYNDEFKTAKIQYKNKKIDLIMMRKEKYKYSGALPSVEKGNLYDDLFRRDFTINSLAYDIKNNRIIDYFSGLDDIKNKKIRKIHKNSYNEDGTRILRAIKYKVRYGFKYEDKDEIDMEIRRGFLSLLTNDRIIKEIILMLKEDKWAEMVHEMACLNIMDADMKENYFFLNLNNYEDKIIKIVLSLKDENWIKYFINNNIINKQLRRAVLNFYKKEILTNLLLSENNYEIYSVLNKLSMYDLKFLMSNIKAYFKVINYIKNLNIISSDKSGKSLINLGYKGKEIGNIIKNDLKFKLNTLV